MGSRDRNQTSEKPLKPRLRTVFKLHLPRSHAPIDMDPPPRLIVMKNCFVRISAPASSTLRYSSARDPAQLGVQEGRRQCQSAAPALSNRRLLVWTDSSPQTLRMLGPVAKPGRACSISALVPG
mmetsp:Transcript_29809/g.88276  ORF Transcript_29809/g.88276 Transcript_29809/m.88276 type:complete len:124 (+) Transcript_29809:624-995(+)